MSARCMLVLALLIGASSYYSTSAAVNAAVYDNARKLHDEDWNNDYDNGQYASDDRDRQQSHSKSRKRSHDKSGKSIGGGSKSSKSKSGASKGSKDSSSSGDGHKNKCFRIMHDTCCRQPSSRSDDDQNRICEELGCSLKNCGKHNDTHMRNYVSSWSGGGYDDDYVRSAKKFPPRGNEFRAARKDDIRSPCPAINTLANHGFVNRDGRDIIVEDLAQALMDVYRVDKDFLMNAPIQSAINLNLTETKDGKNVLTIDQLFQNRDSTTARSPDRMVSTEAQEHDSSHFREDSDLLNDRAASTRLVHEFFEINGGPMLDPMDVMEYQRIRIKESCTRHEENSPRTTRPYTGGHRGGLAIQGALLFVLGQAQTGRNFDRVSSNLHTIVTSETLPEGYDPDENIRLTFADGCDSDDLRDAFRANVDKAICDFCPTDDGFPCDNLEEVPILTFPLGGDC